MKIFKYTWPDTAKPKHLKPGIQYLRSLDPHQTLAWLRDELHGRPHRQVTRRRKDTAVQTIVVHGDRLGLDERNKMTRATLSLIEEWRAAPSNWTLDTVVALFSLPAGMPEGLQNFYVKAPLKEIVESVLFPTLAPEIRLAILETLSSLASKEKDFDFWIGVQERYAELSVYAQGILDRIKGVTIPGFM
ncbi:MAG: hypothetical protein Q7R93_02320 [bacterium]|nr:hypothetical protein [bacterium]